MRIDTLLHDAATYLDGVFTEGYVLSTFHMTNYIIQFFILLDIFEYHITFHEKNC